MDKIPTKFDATHMRSQGLIPDSKREWPSLRRILLNAVDWFVDVTGQHGFYHWYSKHVDAHLTHYNRFVVKTLPTTWCDVTHSMPHVLFHMLVGFVEKEEPFDTTDYDYDIEFQKIGQEIVDLYTWWKTDPFAQTDDAMTDIYPWDNIPRKFGKDYDETLGYYLFRMRHAGNMGCGGTHYPDDHFFWACLIEYEWDVKEYDRTKTFDELQKNCTSSEAYHIKYGFVNRIEAAREAKIDEMCTRLIKIRGYLWT